ncbi:homoserine O-succinyltransferase MetA [Gaopeijia maritima]|uniref:Homoserine O-succinyltransferase n=1 Tax=Gaopeijia maritima TaxID=3119007 RepID=A0ABU9EAF5_9BACT
MPLVDHSGLPTFSDLRTQGHEILTLDRAEHQDIRELHIGFLNMMPDAALRATERQFVRLVGACNRIAQFYVYPFSVPGLARDAETRAYIEDHYSRFEDLREAGLDALIITGANVATPEVEREAFWEPLVEVVEWARESVASVLCSCLATHALVRHLHGIERTPMRSKRWGVYGHHVRDRSHPLVREINTRFDVPHSRHNDVSREQMEEAGLAVLVESDEAGVHIATSPDRFRIIYLQGHPEYDANSLLKEYRREAQRFLAGEIPLPPPFPDHYFDEEARHRARDYLDEAVRARDAGTEVPDDLEQRIEPLLDNTWGDSAKAIVNNWLGLVYQLTDLDRRTPFAPGIDPDDPLGLMGR